MADTHNLKIEIEADAASTPNKLFDFKASVNNEEVPLEVLLSLGACFCSDNTPFYSELYNERISLQQPNLRSEKAAGKDSSPLNEEASKATIQITKCLSEKSAVTRGYDVGVVVRVPQSMSIAYIHTHRYFIAVLDFWQQFFELHKIILRSNASTKAVLVSFIFSMNFEMLEIAPNKMFACKTFTTLKDDRRARIKLNCLINCPSVVVLPLNQLSNQTIIAETPRIRIINRFHLSSTIDDFSNSKIGNILEDDDYDCVIDWMSVKCSETALYDGVRIPNTTAALREVTGYERICRDMFQHFHFLRSRKSVLSRPYDLTVNVFRNLDVAISHRAPDVSMSTDISSLAVKLTTDFYRLLRGFLSMNLGEALVPVPETIPIEEVIGASNKYASFSFRMALSNVEFNCFVPRANEASPQGFDPFASVRLNSARVSFDVFIDSQSELDLICENMELIDTRFLRQFCSYHFIVKRTYVTDK
ncbi:unnamed protein product [Gongylonema pulchrum]|uniref:PX domain-containing protein n=1 Tax=Gongylonema pulchrum TaxID=637853 RepID=A0A183DZR2_9BILA|nr:unnamed protein product [Gongylonema pulchrum]